MKIIRHRVNQLSDLESLAPGLGAEIDLRSKGEKLILTHDAFSDGEDFENYLRTWKRAQRGTLILNPKEDGLEVRLLELMAAYSITNFFLLDLPVPTTVRLTQKQNIKEVAIRVSHYESVESAMKFSGKAKWIWLDCFDGIPLPEPTYALLKGNFKLCIVSPELHGLPRTAIHSFRQHVSKDVDAVCTKFPEDWTY